MAHPPDKQEPIAIIGAACRFAGEASSLGSLWDMISKVKTGHCQIPADRWDSEKWYHPDPDRKGGISLQHGYFMQQDISKFDAPFFSVTAKEAAAMDPMKRMLLEVSYESIENGGIPVEKLMNSRTGCYVGCMNNDYEMISLHDIYDIGHTAAAATSEAMTANRVSWFFGMKGPSLTLDTACSSSLYALHLACQSLRLKETNMSLVAGVNLMINPNTMHQLSAMHMLSPEGISHTFDDRANGYGRGDGIGALIIKRLSDAIRDGDTIRAVIRGTGANADGKTPSVTQPSSESQAELIIQTYDEAGLVQSDTDYCECHGTGTPVGDPLELTGIANTLGASRRAAGKSPLYIGSIKPSVGHTEGCAGLAGVFKSILLLEKGMLVPTYGVERVNPKLKLEDWNLALPQEVSKWETDGLRRISVNSFGFGGANAHVILDDAFHYLHQRGLVGKHNTTIQALVSNAEHNNAAKQLVLVSGKDQTSIKRLSDGLNAWLEENSAVYHGSKSLKDLAYTLGQRRTHLDYRSFAVAHTLSDLANDLAKGLPAAVRSQRNSKNLIMVCTGQGAQWAMMGKALFENPVFRRSVEISQTYLEEVGCTWAAIEELSAPGNKNIDRPEYSQPLCTVLQVALIDTLQFWGIIPAATIGHSSGEIAAAYAASLLTYKDAIKLAYVRGLSSAAVSKQGAMMAAGLSDEAAQKYIGQVPAGSAVVACINSPSSVTISGDVEAINELETLISKDGIFARKLKVTTAYHSPHMREVSTKYLELIGVLTPKQPDDEGNGAVMYSSLTGKVVSSSKELDAQYWVDNMQNPVKFLQGVLSLLKHKQASPGSSRPAAVQWGSVLEVGPHAALQGPLRQIIDASNNKFAKAAPYTSMLMRGKDAIETSLNAVGTLWAAGYNIDMAAVNQHSTTGQSPKMICDLPTYPWNHSKGFWHESYSSKAYRFPPQVRSDLLGVAEDAQNPHEPRWKNYLRVSENPWIEDHVITGTVLYPAAGMLVMALEGALQTANHDKPIEGFRITDVMFERGLVVSLDDASPVETRLSLHARPEHDDTWVFTVYSMTGGSPWVKHCSGTVAIVYESNPNGVEDSTMDALWQKRVSLYSTLISQFDLVNVEATRLYENLDSIGMQYGPSFRNVKTLTAVPSFDASFATVSVPDTAATMPKKHESPHVIHPATMDSIFHLVLASLNAGQPVKQAAVPYSIQEIYVAYDQPKTPGSLYAGYGRLLSQDGHEIMTELVVSDHTWNKPKLTVKNFALRTVSAGDGQNATTDAPSSVADKKCATLTWIPDLSFVAANTDLDKVISTSGKTSSLVEQFLDSVFLKTPNSTLLVVLFDDSASSMDELVHLKTRTYGPKVLTAYATSEAGRHLLHTSLEGYSGTTAITIQWMPETELLQALAQKDYDAVLGLGLPELSKSASTLASLAPLAVFTHAGELDYGNFGISGKYVAHRKTGDGASVMFVAGSVTSTIELPSSVTLLLPSSPSILHGEFAATLQDKIEASGVSVTQKRLTQDDVSTLGGQNVISLLELDGSLVYSWPEEQFLAFKALVSTVKHLFWMTRGGVLENWQHGLEFATTQGLFRVMRNEYPVAVLPSFDISTATDLSSQKSTDLVAKVWRASLDEDAEMEYAELDGLVYVPRATEEKMSDLELQLANNTAKPTISTLGGCTKFLETNEPAHSEGYIWTEDVDSTEHLPLAADEVEVDVEFMGVQASGHTLDSLKHTVGKVINQGKDCADFCSLGQRVIVFTEDAAKTRVRQSKALVAPLPEVIEPAEAIALLEPLIAAQYALVEVARLTEGQTLLLDNAASTIGQALIHVAKASGADVFVLVHSKTERDSIVHHFAIPANRIFDSSRGNFVTSIEDATEHAGVDIVVSQQQGAHTVGALAVLADFGQFIDIDGKKSTTQLPPSKSNATMARIDMAHVMEARPAILSKLFHLAFKKYALSGASPTLVEPITNLANLLKEQRTSTTVLSLADTTPILVPARRAPELELDPNATYILAGGLGALGLNIADWMGKHGAKRLVFFSRSGGSKNKAELDYLRETFSLTAEVYACNITDASSVASVFATLRENGHTIRGVVNLAMVLQDAIFANMTHAQWVTAISPKTHGSRNLAANLLADDQPFYILLSSITGVIGNTAQANYASGNTFEDALANHARAHLGINATSIDVGLVGDSSHFTAKGEFGDLDSYLGRYKHGWKGLTTDLGELGVIMRAAMRPLSSAHSCIPPQVVLGLGDGIDHVEGGYTHDRKFVLRVRSLSGDTALGENGEVKKDVATLLSSASNMFDAEKVVEDDIKTLVAKAMGVEASEVDGGKPLFDYGVDSLQAVDIRNRALKIMRSDISVFDILSAMPLADVAAKIASKSSLVKVGAGED